MKKVSSRSVILLLIVASVAAHRCHRGRCERRQEGGKRPGLRPAAGHEVVRPLGAVRRSGHEGGLREGRRHRFDQQRTQRSAQAEGAGAGLHRRWCDGRHRDRTRQRLCRIDREALHVEGRQVRSTMTARSPVARASIYVTFDGKAVGAGPGQGRPRRHEGERHERRHGRRAVGRPDRPERVLVQERQRRRLQPALQERQDQEGPGSSSSPTGMRTTRRPSSTRCSSRRATTSRACWRRTTTSPAPSSLT